jgi:ParB family chromosome partitioning protein
METASGTNKFDARRRALGKGLESLLPRRQEAPVGSGNVAAIGAAANDPAAPPPAQPTAQPSGTPLEIDLTLIDRNPYQTRTHFDRDRLLELAQSIAAHGVMQPVVLRALPEGRYQLVTGERRWLASFEAKKTHIPAIVRTLSNVQAMEMTIVENLQREDLNPMEQARAYQRLSDEFQLSHSDMAMRTGVPRTTVSNYLRLNKLPERVQIQLEAGELSLGHAKLLLGLDASQIDEAAKQVMALSMSVRQTEKYVYGILNPETRQKPQRIIQPLDPNVREIRDQLQRALGLRVHIEDRDGRGKVIIEYDKLDDFDMIFRIAKAEG